MVQAMTGIEATACACELLYVYIYVYVTLHRKLRWMRCGSTKHRKGPQRTAKELRNTAKDRKGPQKHRKRTAKELRNTAKDPRNIAKGPQRSSETPQRTPETSQKDRKGTPRRDRRLLETRRLLEHELQHPRRLLYVRPTMCKISSAFSHRSYICSLCCYATRPTVFLSACVWSQA